MRRGGRLTAAERDEYTAFLTSVTAEERRWVEAQRGAPMRRPAEPHVQAVLAAGTGRVGGKEYWVRWSDGEEGWGPRPHGGADGARVRAELATARQEYEDEGGAAAGGLRDRLHEKRGPTWLWLATQAPQAVGRRDAAQLVRDARAHGVETAEEERERDELGPKTTVR